MPDRHDLEVLQRVGRGVAEVVDVGQHADLETGDRPPDLAVRDRGLDVDVRQIAERRGLESLMHGADQAQPPSRVRGRDRSQHRDIEPVVEQADQADRHLVAIMPLGR